ncbi:hypothetical protein pb186bvf_015535 [Paramecium bursaria]
MFEEEHYQQSKQFLIAYKDALLTLKQVADQKAQLETEKSIANILLNEVNHKNITIDGPRLIKNAGIKESKLEKLNVFSNQIFNKYFSGLERANDYVQVKNTLQQGLTQLNSEKH